MQRGDIMKNYLCNNKGQDFVEFAIILAFAVFVGILAKDELMTELWNNDEYINENALTVNISRLRSKLSDLGYPDIIETRKGIGYRIVWNILIT